MQVKEIMTPHIETVAPETTIMDTARKMQTLNIGALPVCQRNRILGIVTDRDLVVRAISQGWDPRTAHVSMAMTHEAYHRTMREQWSG